MFYQNRAFCGKNIKVFFYQKVTSTQDIAWQWGLKGAEDGTVIVSECQTKGRGRGGKVWISPPGGLYFSLILRPNFLTVNNRIHIFNLLASLSGAYVIEKETGLNCLLKWPNDILLRKRKIGGVISETKTEGRKVEFLVLGMGINVNTEKKDLPEEATSLFIETKREKHPYKLLEKILERIEFFYILMKRGKTDFILKEWKKKAAYLGEMVEIRGIDKNRKGQIMGIDDDGALILREETGLMVKIYAGDLVKLQLLNEVK